MAKDKTTIDPINDSFENVVDSIAQPAPPIFNKNKGLGSNLPSEPAPPKQIALDLGIEVQKEIDGIEMGVLENGIPYLTQMGLAAISGAARSVIYDISRDWEEHYDDEVLGKDRISWLRQYLFERGYKERELYIETFKDGNSHYAYPDIVCMAILEYYAFEAKSPNAIAVDNFRKLATYGLRRFIYDALQYTPEDKWRHYHDRVSLLKGSAPPGYFTVFNEIGGMVVDLINANLTVNDKTVPDISVGIAWAKHWKDNDLAKQFGDRTPYSHNYPEYFPQAASNPQDANAYPDAALPEFRKWFKETYLLTKFPQYILKKANLLSGGKPEATQIANMYNQKQIPPPK